MLGFPCLHMEQLLMNGAAVDLIKAIEQWQNRKKKVCQSNQ